MSALPPKIVADRDTQAFWDAVAEHRLVVQRCECGKWIWQPKPVCPSCHADGPPWVEVAGEARVVSWTVLHRPVLPVWEDALPFVLVLVELAEAPGVRMIGQLVTEDGGLVHSDEGVETGTAVRVVYRTDEAGQTLPCWTFA